jgi:hypothetical protein
MVLEVERTEGKLEERSREEYCLIILDDMMIQIHGLNRGVLQSNMESN